MPIFLHGVLETAKVLLETGSKVKGLEILALLLYHPVPPAIGKLDVKRLIAKLQDELSAEVFKAAVERGKTLDLETLVQTCLDDLRPSDGSPQTLTERELEILRLIADGLSNQVIANRLILSVGTVKWYTTQIYSKLGVQNRAQAVRHAQQWNLFA